MLDLGLEELNKISKEAEAAQTAGTFCPASNWICDWIITSYLDQITPSCDVTIFKLYANEFGLDISGVEETDLLDLANLYKKQIGLFIVDRIFQKVSEIFNRWINFAERGLVMPKLPFPAKKALNNFLILVKNTTGTDLTPTFMTFFGTLAESHSPRDTHTFDLPDVFEQISKDQLTSYAEICNRGITKAFELPEDFEISKFPLRIKPVIAILKSILWMCEPAVEARGYDSVQLYNRLVLPFTQQSECEKYDIRRSIPLTYALFVNDSNIDLIPEDTDSYPITDAYRVMTTLLYQRHLQEINDCQ